MNNDLLKIVGKKVYGVTDKNCTSVEIPYGITEIEEHAFEDCKNLETVIIPNTVECISSEAFQGCEKLTEIEIPNSVLDIYDSAFRGTALKTFNIPSGLESIDGHVFDNCNHLTSFHVSKQNQCYYEIDGVLFCKGYKGVKCLHTYPLGKEGIEYNVPPKTEILLREAFYYNDGLYYVSFPKSLKEIRSDCFYGCYYLDDIVITENIEAIHDCAFAFTGIKNLTICSEKIEIAKKAFENCSLEELHIKSESPENIIIADDAFDEEVYSRCELYIPYGTKYAFNHHPIFGQFDKVITED